MERPVVKRLLLALLLIAATALPAVAESISIQADWGLEIGSISIDPGLPPAELATGALVELFADTGYTATGTWSDASGNGNHFVNTNSSEQPIASGTGSDTYVYFDGSDDVLKCATLSSQIASNSNTFIGLVKRDSSGGAGEQVIICSDDVTFLVDQVLSNGNFKLYTGTGWIDPAGTSLPADGIKFFAFSMVQPPRGVAVLSGSGENYAQSYTSSGTSKLTLGELWQGQNAHWKGRIYAILVYPRVLSKWEVRGTWSYLQNRFGVTTN